MMDSHEALIGVHTMSEIAKVQAAKMVKITSPFENSRQPLQLFRERVDAHRMKSHTSDPSSLKLEI
jgi:hypothetical protein